MGNGEKAFSAMWNKKVVVASGIKHTYGHVNNKFVVANGIK